MFWLSYDGPSYYTCIVENKKNPSEHFTVHNSIEYREVLLGVGIPSLLLCASSSSKRSLLDGPSRKCDGMSLSHFRLLGGHTNPLRSEISTNESIKTS